MSEKSELPKPFYDSAIWSAVPGIVWAALIVLIVFWFRENLKELFSALTMRLKSGDALKIGVLEIGASSGLVAKQGDFSDEDSQFGVYKDKDGEFAALREEAYEASRRIMMVHRLQRSDRDGQVYDVLIYVVPHKDASLVGVTKVEYFFGKYWGNKVYPSTDRSRGFPIVTAAYGTFLCIARVSFNDGTHNVISRYIDFEMGNLAG